MDYEVVISEITEQVSPAIALGVSTIATPASEETASSDDASAPLVNASSEPLSSIDAAFDGEIKALLAEGDFRGKCNDVLVLYTYGRLPAKRIILVGLGATDKLTLDTLREAGATVAKTARDLGLSELHLVIPQTTSSEFGIARAAEAWVEGAMLGSYRFGELKTRQNNDRPGLSRLVLVAPTSEMAEDLEQGAVVGRVLAESTSLTRDLVNRPSNLASPSHVATTAQEVAQAVGLDCRILDKETLQSLGLNLLLSVNQGGNEPARMVILEHNGGRADLPTVVLVGKGITFDSGGLSLKSSQGMEKMKGDMAGAAAVLGAMRAVALLELPLRVVGLAPLTENMPDALATRPGDVITSLKGLTVEIVNTDAEGRLILADTLTYAGEFEPDAILDVATLTGGRVVALGDHAAAVMGDEALIERLRQAGEATGERVWPLPLFEAYGEQLKSDVADLQNVGGRSASTIIGGTFLRNFVPKDVPWVHIDIAGLGTMDKARPYAPKGATGFGVRLLVDLLRNWGA